MRDKNKHIKDHLQDWILHFNIYTRNWEGVKRDDYNNLFSGGKKVTADTVETLVEVINKRIYDR